MVNPTVSRILLSEWFGFSLAVLMVACVAIGVYDDRPPTEFEQDISYGSMVILSGWFVIKGWSLWRVRGVKPR